MRAPWATLTTRMIPKASVRPLAISAYTPPVRSPRMQAWTKRCIYRRSSSSLLLSPGRLRHHGLVKRHARGKDRHELAADPLDEDVAPPWRAVLVPAQVALDRRPRTGVQRLDDRLVVDRACLLGDCLDDLSDRV